MLSKRPNPSQYYKKVLTNVLSGGVILILGIILVLLFLFVSIFVGFYIQPQAEFHITLNGQDIPDGRARVSLVTCDYPIVDEKHEKVAKELIPYIFENNSDWSWAEDEDWEPECEKLMTKHGLNKTECNQRTFHWNVRMVRYIEYEKAKCNNWCEGYESRISKGMPMSKEECNKWCEKKSVQIPDTNLGCYWTDEYQNYCTNSTCREFAYDLTNKFRFHVYLLINDKDYLSSEVTAKNIISSFKADLLPDGSINLQETTSFIGSDIARKTMAFIILSIIILVIEFFTAWRYIRGSQISKKVLKSVLITNIVSAPVIFWFVFPFLRKIMEDIHYRNDFIFLILGWLFLFIFEGCLIYLFNKKHISCKESFKLSAIINLVSSIIGILIFLFFIYGLVFSL